jgi:hypothetical protein
MHGGGAGDAARESGVSPGDDWRVEWYDDDHEYPHKCMFCGGKAYMGIVPGSRVDCKSKCQGSSK